VSAARIAAANELDKNMDRQLKLGIVGGLISSLLVLIFIQPILTFLWHVILNVGGTLHQGYVDTVYRNAAIAGSNPYGDHTLFVLLVVLGNVGFFWALEKLKADPAADHFPGFTKLVERTIWSFVLMSLLVVFVRAAIVKGTAQIAESFTQRLTVLAPGISDSEYKILKARWASMHGRADYDAIVADMEKRATELGVKLPPVR
jgi:hypothetical protein